MSSNALDEFLRPFPQNRRGVIGNWFYFAVRSASSGTEAEKVVDIFATDVLNRYKQAQAETEREELDNVLTRIRLNHKLTVDAMKHVIAREAMTPAERKAEKTQIEQKAKVGYMESQPATEKQVSYLRKLGYKGEQPRNRQHASDLIEIHLAGKPKFGKTH